MRIENVPYDDKELIEFIGLQQSQKVNWGNSYEERLLSLSNQELIGDTLPWSKTHNDIRLRPGELSMWAGINGHKKSLLLGMVMLNLAAVQRVGMMSFELPVEKTMQRMGRQAAGCEPGQGFLREFAQWNDERICYYDQMDSVPAAQVLGVVYHMAKDLGCQHIVIDSLMMIRLTGYDDKERRFIETLAAACKALGIHIHIVHHMRKPPDSRGEDYVPNKFDVRGDSGLIDKVDNLFIVWASKKRQRIKRLIDRGQEISDKEQTYFDEMPDQLLICDKQRYGEWEDRVGLWFHSPSLQFIASNRDKPIPFDISGQENAQQDLQECG